MLEQLVELFQDVRVVRETEMLFAEKIFKI